MSSTTPPIPSIYQWVPAIERFTEPGDMIIEIAAAHTSSAAAVAAMMGRQVALAKPPSPGRQHECLYPRLPDGELVTDARPALVLLPLPLPVDGWSIIDYLRAQVSGGRLFAVWGPPAFAQPELALDLEAYLDAVDFRIRSIRACVPSARIALAVPCFGDLVAELADLLGLGAGGEASWMIREAGGTRHRGPGGHLVPGVLVQVVQ